MTTGRREDEADRRVRLQGVQPGGQVRGEGLPFPLAHREHVTRGLLGQGLYVRPRHRRRALSPIARHRQHVGVAGHEGQIRLALQSELFLQLAQRRNHLPRSREIERHRDLGLRRREPAGRHRHVTALEQRPQPVAQLALDAGELEWQSELGVEVAVVDGTDLNPQPSAEHRPIGRSEPRHAPRHSR